MNCKDFEELIALDVAGDLLANEAAQVQAHLRRCHSCRDFAGELSADLEWLHSTHQEVPEPAALHQVRVGVMRQIESEQNRWTPPFGGIGALGWRWQWIVAAAAVAIVVGSLAWWNTSANQRQGSVAVGSDDPYRQRPEAAKTPPDRQAGPSAVKADPPIRTESAGAAIPPARTQRDAREDRVSTPQLASLAPRDAPNVRAPQPRFETLGDTTNLEIVTARLEEPQQAPEEAVMLKIPTSNPNIVVYWLMDEEQQPEEIEENKGD